MKKRRGETSNLEKNQYMNSKKKKNAIWNECKQAEHKNKCWLNPNETANSGIWTLTKVWKWKYMH